MNKKLIKEYLEKQKIKIVEDFDFDKKTISYSKKIKQNHEINKISGNEEIVRAYILTKLVNELGYRPENIEIEKEYTQSPMGRKKKNQRKGRIDVLVKDVNNNPFLFVELKDPHEYESGKEDIEGQLFTLASEEENKYKTKVRYLIYYTIDTIDENIYDNFILIDRDEIQSYENWKDKGSISGANKLPYNYNKPKKELLKNKDLKILDREKLDQIRTKIHNTLWSSGVEDNEAYLFLVKYILTKVYDETNTKPSHPLTCQIYDSDFENEDELLERINNKYIEALEQKLNFSGGDLKGKVSFLLGESVTISRLYFIVELLEQFSFSESLKNQKEDILGAFFEETNRDKFKQDKGQYFTHTNIANFIIYGLGLNDLAKQLFDDEQRLPYVIDPSVGSGTFLIELMKIITSEFKKMSVDELSQSEMNKFRRLFPDERPNEWAESFLYGIDNSHSLAISTKVNMILHGDGSSKIIKNDGIANFQVYKKINDSILTEYNDSDPKIYGKNNHDFFVNEKFDVVISNPPFSVKPTESTEERIKHFLFGDKKNSENLFIERWYQLLKENGRLGVVLPESVFDTTENKYIRLFIYKYFKVKAVVSLPQLTFEPFTSTKTSLLFAQKKTKREIEEWTEFWNKYSNEWVLLKTRCENLVNVYLDEKYLFNWDDVKEDNVDTFIEYLKNKFKIGLVENVTIKKTNDYKAIKVSTEKNCIWLNLNDDKNRVVLKIDDIRTFELNAWTEKGKLNIYNRKDRTNLSSIKDLDEEQEKQFLTRMLKDYIEEGDKSLSPKALIEKYVEELKELCKFDKGTQDVFGFVNTWWVFGEVAKELNYKIFMAEVENVGYKRGNKRREKPRPNELYRLDDESKVLVDDGGKETALDYLREIQWD